MKIRNAKDLWTGALLAATGAGFGAVSLTYPLGGAAQPGPGYFPLLLSGLLVLLASVLIVRGFRSGDELAVAQDEAMEPIAWRALTVVVATIALFGFALPHLGVAITFPLVILCVSLASAEFNWRRSVLYAVVLSAGAWLVFVVLLRLPLPLWPV